MSACIKCNAAATQEAQFRTISLTDREHGINEGDIFNQTSKLMVCDLCSMTIFNNIMSLVRGNTHE